MNGDRERERMDHLRECVSLPCDVCCPLGPMESVADIFHVLLETPNCAKIDNTN